MRHEDVNNIVIAVVGSSLIVGILVIALCGEVGKLREALVKKLDFLVGEEKTES